MGAQVVEEPQEGESLPMHGGSPGVGDVDEIAIVIPLEERDVVLVQQGEQGVADMGVGVRVLQVQDLLVPPLVRQVAPPPQDPVRVGARQVGVGIDHLGLDPQADVHPELLDAVDERVQPVGPDGGIDGPVAEPTMVVASTAEPPVIQDETLDADACCCLGERRQV